jgi:hypothetical protein
MAKYKVRLDTDRNCVELTLPSGDVEYYQSSYGSATDLYQDLRAAAAEDPTSVMDFLTSAAEQVEPVADPDAKVVQEPKPAVDTPEPVDLQSESSEWVSFTDEDDFESVLFAIHPDAKLDGQPTTGVTQWKVGPRTIVGWWDEIRNCGMVKDYVGEDAEVGEGVLGKAGGDNPYDGAVMFGDINNFDVS